MPFATQEAIYYGACFAIGFFVGACRIIRDREYQSLFSTMVAAASTGSFCFAIVAILDHYFAGGASDPWVGLAMSTLVGLGSKEQDRYVRALLRFTWKKAGLPIEDLDKSE